MLDSPVVDLEDLALLARGEADRPGRCGLSDAYRTLQPVDPLGQPNASQDDGLLAGRQRAVRFPDGPTCTPVQRLGEDDCHVLKVGVGRQANLPRAERQRDRERLVGSDHIPLGAKSERPYCRRYWPVLRFGLGGRLACGGGIGQSLRCWQARGGLWRDTRVRSYEVYELDRLKPHPAFHLTAPDVLGHAVVRVVVIVKQDAHDETFVVLADLSRLLALTWRPSSQLLRLAAPILCRDPL